MKKRKIYSYLQRSLLKILTISFNSSCVTSLAKPSLRVEKISPLRLNVIFKGYVKKKFNCHFFLVLFQSRVKTKKTHQWNWNFGTIEPLKNNQKFFLSREQFFHCNAIYFKKILIVRTDDLSKKNYSESYSSSTLFNYLQLSKSSFFFFKTFKACRIFYRLERVSPGLLELYRKSRVFSSKQTLSTVKNLTSSKSRTSQNLPNSFFFQALPLLDIIFYARKKYLGKVFHIFFSSKLLEIYQLNPNRFITLKPFFEKINLIDKTQPSYFFLMRPLFTLTRLDTFYICETLRLPTYPDKSNLKVNFLRNRVRKQILPAIRILLNPQFDTILCKFNNSE